MGDMTVGELLSIADSLTTGGLLVAVLIGGARAIWVWGWTHRERVTDLQAQLLAMKTDYELRLAKVEQDATEWKIIAINATDIGKRVVSVAEKSVKSDDSSG